MVFKVTMAQVFADWLGGNLLLDADEAGKAANPVPLETDKQTYTTGATQVSFEATKFMDSLRSDLETYGERSVVCDHGQVHLANYDKWDYHECVKAVKTTMSEATTSPSALKLWFAGLWVLGKQQDALTKIVKYEVAKKPFPNEKTLSEKHRWCINTENRFVGGTFTREALWNALPTITVCRQKMEAEEDAFRTFFGLAWFTAFVMIVLASIAHCGDTPCLKKMFCMEDKCEDGDKSCILKDTSKKKKTTTFR